MRTIRLVVALVSLTSLGGCVSSPWFGGSYPPAAPDGGVNATFLGVSTIVFESHGHAVATDGFLSRPDAIALSSVEPDRTEIDRVWAATGVKSLNGVVTVHSHYDHAMDAAVLAQKTGAVLIGSRSTKFIADGLKYKGPFRPLDPHKPTEILLPTTAPVFKITAVRSEHGDTPFNSKGEIKKKLVPPVPFWQYKDGGSYSIFIEFLKTGKRVLVHASAGHVTGALKGFRADVVYLGITPLGGMKPDDQEKYWREVVVAVCAKRVFPIHWDDMFDRLQVDEEELRPMLRRDFDKAMKFLDGKRETGVEVILPRTWRKTDPFADLPPGTCPQKGAL